MARFRRGNYLRPVNTLKHIVDQQGALTVDNQDVIALVFGADNPGTGANPEQVTIGSHVKSLFLNVQVSATSTASIANVYMIVYGNPGNNIPSADIPDGNKTGVSDFRKNIFHTEMIMTEKNTTAMPRTLFKGVLKVPRKFARIGASDRIDIALYAPGTTQEYCIECIYKEIR